jgi:hypothetical protein
MPSEVWDDNFKQPLAFGSFRNWLRLVRDNGVDRAYWQRALFVTLTSLATSPLRAYERLRYDEIVGAQRVTAPVFILGHWRSGTTHLHYLMTQDKAWGFIPTLQTIAPEILLSGARTIAPAVRARIPKKRMMDNVELALDGPQEEEFALANMSRHCCYHHFSFPRRARFYFDRYAIFKDTPPLHLQEWRRTYLAILCKASYLMGGRRLLIKNPVNTGRIAVLAELFPDARFIHIYRDPYRIFQSTCHLYRQVLRTVQLQALSEEELVANVLYFYKAIMERYLADRAALPADRLVEVRFEDLERAPLPELERIYTALALPGYVEAAPAFAAYVASQQHYQKNRYELQPEQIKLVNASWGFAFKAWGYDML